VVCLPNGWVGAGSVSPHLGHFRAGRDRPSQIRDGPLVPERTWGFKSPIGQISKVSMNRFACPGVRGVSFSTFHRHRGEYRLVWHGHRHGHGHGHGSQGDVLMESCSCRVDAAAPPESPRTEPNPYEL
jgi:hypothetical protein